MNKPKPKFSPEMAKLLRSIDMNTRAIAKLDSARQWLLDWEIIEGCAQLECAHFAAMQERRNLKLQFEEEWKRLHQ